MGCDVLVIEDDRDIREVIVELLQSEGYSVEGAEHGEEGLRKLAQMERPPRLILLDLMMPVMSGWQFLEARRSVPPLSSVPVVLLSAYANLSTAAASLGVNGFLPKPIDLSELVTSVEQSLTP